MVRFLLRYHMQAGSYISVAQLQRGCAKAVLHTEAKANALQGLFSSLTTYWQC